MSQINSLNVEEEVTDSLTDHDLSTLESKLPEVFRRLLAPHRDSNEWLMALMANIAVSGTLIPEVWATYGGRKTYPMLMLFVLCPPAAGKGVVGLSGKLLELINRELREKHKGALVSYRQEHDLYKASLKTESAKLPPIKPKRSQLLVSGNITSSKLIQQIADNERVPLMMVESEADVLAASFKSEHGTLLSSLIRLSFHHERISLSRRTDDEVLEVENPKVAMVLTGTDNQIVEIFKGNQDGLFSRFLFLRNLNTIKWRSGRPTVGTKSLDDHYNDWALRFFKTWQQTQNVSAEIRFTEPQWDRIDECGRSQQAQALFVGGKYSISIARRHSLMAVRMATILSFFRRLDPSSGVLKTTVGGWTCDDVDVDLALDLTSISFKNSLDLFQVMPQQRGSKMMNKQRTSFFNDLPENCDMTDINSYASKYMISDRTKTRLLKELCDVGMLEKIGRGQYKKTPLALMALMSLTETTDALSDAAFSSYGHNATSAMALN